MWGYHYHRGRSEERRPHSFSPGGRLRRTALRNHDPLLRPNDAREWSSGFYIATNGAFLINKDENEVHAFYAAQAPGDGAGLSMRAILQRLRKVEEKLGVVATPKKTGRPTPLFEA